MAYEQGFGGRDARRQMKPVVPPEFQERVQHGQPQSSFGYQDTVASGWQSAPVQPVQPIASGNQGSVRPMMGAPYAQQPAAAPTLLPYRPMPYYDQAPFGSGRSRAATRRQSHAVRNVLAGVGGAVGAITVVGVGILIAAAGSTGHNLQLAGTSGNAAAPLAKATVGTAITLTGNDSGERMDVTVTKVISDASPTDSFDAPPAGDRLVAVQFRLTDAGSAPYSDSPSNGSAVVDASGQSYQAGFETVTGCQSFGGTENIAPGQSGLGCVTFEVPKTEKIVAVQFTLDSGMGPDTGQWSVPTPASASRQAG